MLHKPSFDRLQQGPLNIVHPLAVKLAGMALELKAPKLDTTFHFLADGDTDCEGEYTVDVVVSIRKIGPAD